jgi:hypothetical protein
MTYRNDHEAALARIDSLEHELAGLRDKTPATAAPRRRKRTGLVVAGAMAALGFGVLGGVALVVASNAPPRRPAAEAPVGRDFIVWCADAIQPGPVLDAEHTDPRATHPVTVEPIGHTGAPCRDELRRYLDTPDLSSEERDALWKWAIAEDELAGATSRIEVYYASDPYKLDSYSTANQLWLEYDRAYFSRNRALVAWRDAR